MFYYNGRWVQREVISSSLQCFFAVCTSANEVITSVCLGVSVCLSGCVCLSVQLYLCNLTKICRIVFATRVILFKSLGYFQAILCSVRERNRQTLLIICTSNFVVGGNSKLSSWTWCQFLWLWWHLEVSSTSVVAVWLSGNALALNNVVALHWTRLVLGWVTISGYTILMFKQATQTYSAWPWVGTMVLANTREQTASSA